MRIAEPYPDHARAAAISTLKQLQTAPGSMQDQAMLRHIRQTLHLRDSGRLTDSDAAQLIAAGMFVEGVDEDPLREEITIVAGELEVPMSSAAARKRWRKLALLADELETRIHHQAT